MANEFSIVVPLSTSGHYGIVRNPANHAQGWDNVAQQYETINTGDADQQVAFGSAVAVGDGVNEIQFATIPSNLSAAQEHDLIVYDSSDVRQYVIRYSPQYEAQTLPEVTLAANQSGVTLLGGIDVSGSVIPSDAPTAEQNRSEMDANSTVLASIDTNAGEAVDQTVIANGNLDDIVNDGVTLTTAERSTLATAIEAALLNEGDGQQLIDAILQVINSNLDLPALELTAIAQAVRAELVTTLFLDRLFAADYDPASKPGVSTALLNELVESDGGVSRLTANALEQAPAGGGGGGATVEEVWSYGSRTLTSGGGGSTTPFLNKRVAPANTLELSNFRNGRTIRNAPIRLTEGAEGELGSRRIYKLLLGSQIAMGDATDGMVLPVSRDMDVFTVIDEEGGESQWGVSGKDAVMFTLQAPIGASAGDASYLDLELEPEDGERLLVSIAVEIIAREGAT